MVSPDQSTEPGSNPDTTDSGLSAENLDQQQPTGARSSDANSHGSQKQRALKHETSFSGNSPPEVEGSSNSSLEESGDFISSRIPDSKKEDADIKFLDAARRGNAVALKEAMDVSANLGVTARISRETALHLACRLGHYTVLKQLLGHEPFMRNIEAHITALDIDGWTPLHSACSGNGNEFKRFVDKFILRDGDQIETTLPAHSITPIKTKQVLDELLPHCNTAVINTKDGRGQTALHMACFRSPKDSPEKDSPKEVPPKEVPSKEVPSKETPSKEVPSKEAPSKEVPSKEIPSKEVSFKDVIGLLIEKGADVNASTPHDKTPLTIACVYQSSDVVEMLLNKEADCNSADADGNTPLTLAAEYGDADMVKSILKRMPDDVNKKNDHGEGALSRALFNKEGRDVLIPLLLNRGLKLDFKDEPKVFPRRSAANFSGDDLRESAWLRIVQMMLETHDPFTDLKLSKTIPPLLESASKEEMMSAVLQAKKRSHFEELSRLTSALSLHKDVSKLIWQANKNPESKDIAWMILENIILENLKDDLGEEERVAEFTWDDLPDTLLQYSAYHGDHRLVWYLLKTSQSKQRDDIRRAIEIARQRMPKSSLSGKGGPERPEDPASKKPNQDDDSKRYALTIDVLQNATAFVSLSNKLPERPDPRDMQGKEELLQKHHATIVDFYGGSGGRGDQIDLLRASPSVFDVVYAHDGSTVNDIMKTARSTFNDMISTTENPKIHDENKPRLRWIHLPANHVDWMEHLTLRIYDEKSSENREHREAFFDMVKRSRVELPTGESTIKFMKPICLKEELLPKPNDTDLGPRDPDLQQDIDTKDSKEKDGERGDERPEFGDSEGDHVEENKSEVISQQARHAEAHTKPTGAIRGAARQDKTEDSSDIYQESSRGGLQRLALYTPYITLGYCDVSEPTESYSKYSELTKEYAGRILHGRRSLDRFYYHALSDDKMKGRDRSQVVTRGLLKEWLLKEEMVTEDITKWPYLTVDQLWVWVIDDKTIVSSSTHREDGFDDIFVDKIFDQLRKGSHKGTGYKPPSSAIEMSHFLVGSCADFINSLTWKDVCQQESFMIKEDVRSKPIVLFYSDSLNKVMADEKDLFQDFKNRIKKEKRIAAERAQGKEKQATQQNINAQEKLEQDTKDWAAINRAATLLDEVKDIRDELVILRFLVARQESVWNGLMGSALNNHDARSPSFTANELDEMIKTTDTIQKSVNDLLTLEEDSIKIKESIMSRDLVEKSAKQSATLVDLGTKADKQSAENARQEKILMLFTVVTVVFTPLSFLASFYALNTSTSRHNDDGELEYEPEWMNERIYGISAAIVVPLLIYAFFGEIKKLLVLIEKMIDRITWPWLVDLQWILGLIKWTGPVATHKTDSALQGGYRRSDSRRSSGIMLEEGMSAVENRRRHYNTPA